MWHFLVRITKILPNFGNPQLIEHFVCNTCYLREWKQADRRLQRSTECWLSRRGQTAPVSVSTNYTRATSAILLYFMPMSEWDGNTVMFVRLYVSLSLWNVGTSGTNNCSYFHTYSPPMYYHIDLMHILPMIYWLTLQFRWLNQQKCIPEFLNIISAVWVRQIMSFFLNCFI